MRTKKASNNTPEIRIAPNKIWKHNIFFRTVVQLACVMILGIFIYSNTFNSPFAFDDILYITYSPVVKDHLFFLDSSKVDTLPGSMGTIKEQFRNRVVGHFTFWINYRMHGFNIMDYHLVNLLIHLLNALLVYLLVFLTFKTPFIKDRAAVDSAFNTDTGKMIAFLCALLFVTHPIQTQAVTYITQRFTSLATLFYLLSLALYVKARLSEQSGRRYAYYFISLVSAILAMKTKEISFTLPVIMTLYEFMFFKGSLKKRIGYLSPFLLTMAIIPLTLLYSGASGTLLEGISSVSKETATISRADYLFTQFSVITTYLRLLFLPINQNVDYDYPVYNSFFMPQVWLPFLFLLSLFVLAVYLLYRSRKETAYSWGFRLISFGILYFFIAVSVESSLIPIKDVIFEHRVYLPSFGFFLCFTVCIFLIKNRLREPLNRAVIPALVLVIIILAGAAYARNTIWSSSLALWEDAVKKSPMKARPHINLGKALFDRGDTDAAIKEYLSAINLDPNYDAAYSNLGACYESLGRLDEAIPQLLTAIRLNPYEPKPYMTLGLIYGRQGLFEQAIEEFRMVIKNSPNSAEAHHNLGVALYKNGLLKEAYAEVLFSIKLNPELSGAAHRNLAVIKGKLDSVR